MDSQPNTTQAPDEAFSPFRLGTVLFLQSFASVLFVISLYRMLTFFIMPSLFFDLLFIGFPLGAMLGVRYFAPQLRSYLKSLWVLQTAMLLSVLAMFACKHFDYMRAHLFDVEIHRLLIQMGSFTAFFLPFFCAYGLSEYVGYRVGRKSLAGRMPIVYALFLFGAAGAYFFVELAVPRIGIARLLILSFLIITVGKLLIRRGRRLLIVELVALLAGMFVPGLEGAFIETYKGQSPGSTRFFASNGYEMIHQKWGSYSFLEIMRSRKTDNYIGFYNDLLQWEYVAPHGFDRRSLGMIPIDLVPDGGSVAIIGAGGGRQVQYAIQSRRHFERILAIELEPAVLEAVRGPFVEDFEGVYEHESVEVVCREARGYFEQSTDRFDLIYLPSVGGYPQMMLEPGNMIRTVDAFRTLSNHLTDQGVLAIWYPAGLDPKGILTGQYIRTLADTDLEMNVRSFFDGQQFLILATASDRLQLPRVEDVQEFYQRPADDKMPMPPITAQAPIEIEPSLDRDRFAPISDDRPFLAGNVQHIFSLADVIALYAIVTSLLVMIGGLLVWAIRKSGNPQIPGRSYLRFAATGFLIGANFLLIERFVILALFRRMYVFHDAVVLGAISFLVVSGLGSILINRRWRLIWQITGAIAALALCVLHPFLPTVAVLCILAPVVFVTGSFFPELFEAASNKPLGVFATDALGAAAGSITAFFIPIVLGFNFFFAAAMAVFLLTVVATFLFFRTPRTHVTQDNDNPTSEIERSWEA